MLPGIPISCDFKEQKNDIEDFILNINFMFVKFYNLTFPKNPTKKLIFYQAKEKNQEQKFCSKSIKKCGMKLLI